MSSLQVDYLVQKEKYQDLIRAAEQDRLLQVVKQQNASHGGWHRNLASWVGFQMIKWGAKLHQYGSVSTTQSNYLPN